MPWSPRDGDRGADGGSTLKAECGQKRPFLATSESGHVQTPRFFRDMSVASVPAPAAERKHFYAPVTRPPQQWSYLTSIVLYALPQPVAPYEPYLAIRYENFDEQLIDGDSLCLTLQEAKTYAAEQFGVAESEWQELAREKLLRIPLFNLGRRVHPDDL